jgi:hypothetical protein
MLDTADCRVHHQPTGETGEIVHHRPEMLDVARILADEPALEILDGSDRCLIRSGGIRFTYPVNALVGLHLHEHEIPVSHANQKRFDVRDLYGRTTRR